MEKGDSWRSQFVCNHVYALCIIWICYLVSWLSSTVLCGPFYHFIMNRYTAHLVEFEGVPFSDIIGVRALSARAWYTCTSQYYPIGKFPVQVLFAVIIGAFFLGHSTSNLSLLLDAAKAAVPIFQVIDRVSCLGVSTGTELASSQKGSGTLYTSTTPSRTSQNSLPCCNITYNTEFSYNWSIEIITTPWHVILGVVHVTWLRLTYCQPCVGNTIYAQMRKNMGQHSMWLNNASFKAVPSHISSMVVQTRHNNGKHPLLPKVYMGSM